MVKDEQDEPGVVYIHTNQSISFATIININNPLNVNFSVDSKDDC